jgi:hypothetical protein
LKACMCAAEVAATSDAGGQHITQQPLGQGLPPPLTHASCMHSVVHVRTLSPGLTTSSLRPPSASLSYLPGPVRTTVPLRAGRRGTRTGRKHGRRAGEVASSTGLLSGGYHKCQQDSAIDRCLATQWLKMLKANHYFAGNPIKYTPLHGIVCWSSQPTGVPCMSVGCS